MNSFPTRPTITQRLIDLSFKFFALAFPAVMAHIMITDGDGCGDTPRDFVFFKLMPLVALGLALVWSIIDKQRHTYRRLKYLLQVIVRYFLAFKLMDYGLSKIADMQFGVSLANLDSRVVDMRPMSVAWTFFGYSYAYECFIGWGQIIACVLLLFRRTANIGTILMLTILANIVFVNFAFDVCVKFFSSTYLVMCIYLLLDDAKRFADFFLFNKATEPRSYPPLSQKRPARRVLRVVNVLFFVLVLAKPVDTIFSSIKQYHLNSLPPLYGVWSVDSLYSSTDSLNRQQAADTSGWKRIIVNRFGYAYIRSWTNWRGTYKFTIDSNRHSIGLNRHYPDTTATIKGSYRQQKDTVLINAVLNRKDSLFIKMHLLPHYFIRKK